MTAPELLVRVGLTLLAAVAETERELPETRDEVDDDEALRDDAPPAYVLGRLSLALG